MHQDFHSVFYSSASFEDKGNIRKRQNLSLRKIIENFFDTLFSYPNPNSYVVVVYAEEMTFEDYVSVVYEYIKIVHKHRNDYCLKTYGKPFGRLDHSHQKEVKELYPQNILIR